MDEIPFVTELGRRLESGIERSTRRSRRSRPLVGVAAFAATVVVVGAVAGGTLLLQSATPAPDVATTQPVVSDPANTQPIALTDIAAALPTPALMTPVIPVAESPNTAPLDTETRKFRGLDAGSDTTITVNLIGTQQGQPTVLGGEPTQLGELEVFVANSGELTSVTWDPANGFVIQVLARGPLPIDEVLTYVTSVNDVVNTAISRIEP